MKRLRIAMTLAVAACGASITGALAAAPVYADHESRNRVLSESGLNIILVILVLVAAVAAMAAFAFAILWWERRDADANDQD